MIKELSLGTPTFFSEFPPKAFINLLEETAAVEKPNTHPASSRLGTSV